MNRLVLVGLILATLACTPAPTISPEPELDPRVARLCGTWRAPGDEGSTLEERWHPSDEGLAGEGVTIDARGERVIGESFAIVLRPAGSTYRALPKGATGWTEFAQTEDHAGPTAGQWAWAWSNPNHDFPQTIRYEFTSEDRMHASVSGPDGEGGTLKFGWSFERVEACAD